METTSSCIDQEYSYGNSKDEASEDENTLKDTRFKDSDIEMAKKQDAEKRISDGYLNVVMERSIKAVFDDAVQNVESSAADVVENTENSGVEEHAESVAEEQEIIQQARPVRWYQRLFPCLKNQEVH